ncbi:Elongation factor P--(R)-beta-lysine ligase [Pontiella desulfatans]|uniref:Elongation factor P--(R)-beta-lysine ligase n=1 Tax=Pontiella desulfatans TaxID=2750659 RepID=A0A6C2U526_PONDE|nr:EF-P lysine aminoacylase EpmA [Pontiella desulfatans]VGO14506.1 Elongation factor P--(R)-beta-lysine ligase [Pontiella desulfatans]
MAIDSIRLRDALMRRMRAFFHERGFVEVETPVRLETPCMELHIDAEPSGDHFLRTSPEIFHKQLLAAGHERIFEVGKCFRRGERGALHHPEYTMLEWYRAHADYMGILEETKALVSAVWNDGPVDWRILTVSEAFLEYAGWDPVGNYDEDRFDLDLVEKVEPAIKAIGGAVVLKDVPVEAAALSRRKAGNPLVAERWELYIEGIELANAYSELTDPVEQRARFEACAKQRKAMGKEVYPIDEAFISALGNMPPSGGVALGVDRLLMLMAGARSLDAVLPFR